MNAQLTTRQSLLEVIANLSKDAHGFKDRTDRSHQSEAELLAEIDRLEKAVQESIAQERALEDRADAEWMNRMRQFISIGAGNMPTAIRWDMQAYGATEVGYYCYLVGLSFELESSIEVYLRVQKERRVS